MHCGLDVVDQVTEKAAGMFLLVRLHLDSLASKNNRQALRQALITLPKDINHSYDETMTRILAQGEDDANLACHVFLWLTYSQEPLTVTDLQHALAISPGMTAMNADAITDIEILTSVCAGLVVIEENWWDRYPRLVHYTTREYFTHEASQRYFRLKETEEYFELSGKPLASDLFAHFHIVATCITYMAFEGLKTGQEHDDMALFRLSYSKDGRPSAVPSGGRLQGHISSKFFNSAEVLGSLGLVQLTSMLFDRGVPINSKDRDQRTILFYAVRKGHIDMVKWLLGAVNKIGLPGQQLFNLNDVDNYGMTLLHHAISREHPTIAEFLLDLPEINADVTDIYGRTPLSYAAESSYTQIADLLCWRADVNPNSYDNDGKPPLYYAIHYNHVETVRILLRLPNIDLGPFQPSPRQVWEDLDSPLKVAAQLGDVDIVDCLLKHPDVDPNWKGHGKTPLAYAIMRGHLEVVNLFLQHSDIQPNLMSGQQDYQWVMPPLWHVVNEREMGMGKQLLQHPDIDIDLGDCEGWTPLSLAVLCNYEEVVESLLRHPHIHPDIPDEMGRTPLMLAAMEGHESLFHLLVQSEKVTTDLADLKDARLLVYAIFGGNQKIIHHVLDELHTTSECKDCHLCAPLYYAAVEGYRDVVQLLLGHNDFQHGPRDDVYMTEWFKRPTVVHLLLPDQNNLSPSSRHRQHFITLIDYALRWGYTGIAALLCQHMETEDSLGEDSWK
ncbi:ankyrin repeat-containing domain protein [Mycena floridula]|nr:ankyrin repeat-containing domain protein [Mycena floridula]